MFLTFDKDKCPLCGTFGEESEIEDVNSCPRCGTKFNEFGVILAKKNEIDLHWN
ncbi:MAG: hypothetical protein ACLFS3_00225 [Candidatus Aenigmatarchaeota archaeon]